MSDTVDPDETAHYELSHLDLRCFQKPIIIACGSERFQGQHHKNVVSDSVLVCTFS